MKLLQLFRKNPEWLLYIAFTQAAISILGSLYYSEVLHLTPCLLCWYQRIAMYPQVLIIGAAIVKEDKNVMWYGLPLAIIGWIIALYHNLLMYNILESAETCSGGVSCTDIQVAYLGFITIPFLSLVAFTVVCGSLIAYQRTVSSA